MAKGCYKPKPRYLEAVKCIRILVSCLPLQTFPTLAVTMSPPVRLLGHSIETQFEREPLQPPYAYDISWLLKKLARCSIWYLIYTISTPVRLVGIFPHFTERKLSIRKLTGIISKPTGREWGLPVSHSHLCTYEAYTLSLTVCCPFVLYSTKQTPCRNLEYSSF